jgi:uncharacterized protein YdcH (DUF465 family)
MDKDDEIVGKLLKEDMEFGKLMALHSELEGKLEDFNRKHYLSDNERVERKNIKKKKLAVKDKLAVIIKNYKAS